MGAGTGAVFTIEGGTMNVAGRLTSANAVTYTQSGGTVNICVAGGCATTPSFGFTSTLPTNVMNMSGGTINLVNSNTLTTADWNQQGTINFTGGTVQFGTAATATNFNFRLQGNAPNVVDRQHDEQQDAPPERRPPGSTATSPSPTGTTFNPNNAILNMLGEHIHEQRHDRPASPRGFTTSRLQFAGAVAQTYTGTGTVCTRRRPAVRLRHHQPRRGRDD